MYSTLESKKFLLNCGVGLLNHSVLFVMRILDYTREDFNWKELGLLGDKLV